MRTAAIILILAVVALAVYAYATRRKPGPIEVKPTKPRQYSTRAEAEAALK